jgi:hypothetical protein
MRFIFEWGGRGGLSVEMEYIFLKWRSGGCACLEMLYRVCVARIDVVCVCVSSVSECFGVLLVKFIMIMVIC